jgi:D-glycerate 3-kinase
MSKSPHSKSAKGFPPDVVASIFDMATGCPERQPVFAIAGLQGTGKSTLAAQLAQAGHNRGLHVVAMSIDDFYLTRRERLALGRQVHPLLATRGPPGTHDVTLACRSLDALRTMRPGDEVRLPRFDKLSDRRLPPSHWRVVRKKPDLIIFEGWFLKVPPESEQALRRPLNSLERQDDKTGTWRHYCNRALTSYQPLWRRLDCLLFLQGPGFAVVPAWRSQQERTLQASNPRRRAMSRAQVERFVLFFERISRQAMRTLPAIADYTLRLDAQRRVLK